MTTFQDLGLAQPLLKALAAAGHHTPTPIQERAIPAVLQGRDLLGMAQTGTGKTAAFALPILHRLLAENRPTVARSARILVLAPTRELATQIATTFQTYAQNTRLTITTVYGGVDMGRQIRTMSRGVDILVATPGRLDDHLRQRTVSLGAVEAIVLDEVDRMLDMGFVQTVRRFLGLIPAGRQTLFFSATLPREIKGLADELLTDPVAVTITPTSTTADRVEQRVLEVGQAEKRPMLAALLVDPAVTRALVFTRTKHRADQVTRYLGQQGIEAAAIHGNKSQNQRERALAAFRAGRSRVLVATDIAARGIDVDGISHVVNFDLPDVAEAYVHRIGRTARAGAAGLAISFREPGERGAWRGIESAIRQQVPTMARPVMLTGPVGPPLADDAPTDFRPERPRGERSDAHRERRSQGARPYGHGAAPQGAGRATPRPRSGQTRYPRQQQRAS